jgi:hypothetical protein
MVFSPFQGEQPIDHILYVGSDPLLFMQYTGQLHLTFRLPSPMQPTQIRPLLDAIQWEVFRGGRWEPLPSPSADLPDTFHDFTLTFSAFNGADVLTLSGPGAMPSQPSRWIRGRLTQPITQLPIAADLWVDSLILQIDQQVGTGIPPDHVHVNAAPVDFTRSFFPLGENPRVGDTVFIASTEALEKASPSPQPEERGRVHLAIDIDVGDAALQWEYYGAEQNRQAWLPLKEGSGVFDETHALTQDGKILLNLPTPPVGLRVEGSNEQSGEFVFFRVAIEDGTYGRIPCLRALRLFLQIQNGQERLLAPVIAFTSETPLETVIRRSTGTLVVDPTDLIPVDLRHPFYPFGISPAIGNTFYFGLDLERNIDPGQLTEPPVLLTPQTARLVWEFLSPQGWQRLGGSSTREDTLPPMEHEFRDTTFALTHSGTVSFQRPADLALGQVNGQTDYWIRARLISGLYGRAAEFMLVDPADPAKGFKLRPSTGALNAPVVRAIRLGYEAQDPSPLVLTYNHFYHQDETESNRTLGKVYRPFEPIDDSESTFYLAFDQKLPNDAVNLYFVVSPRQFVEKLP